MGFAKKKNIEIPVSIFETAQTKEELEDWLLGQDANFIKKMRAARKEDLEGKGKDWQDFKKGLCTE